MYGSVGVDIREKEIMDGHNFAMLIGNFDDGTGENGVYLREMTTNSKKKYGVS